MEGVVDVRAAEHHRQQIVGSDRGLLERVEVGARHLRGRGALRGRRDGDVRPRVGRAPELGRLDHAAVAGLRADDEDLHADRRHEALARSPAESNALTARELDPAQPVLGLDPRDGPDLVARDAASYTALRLEIVRCERSVTERRASRDDAAPGACARDQRRDDRVIPAGRACVVRIHEYAASMRRITVTLDEELAELVEADVAAGRAPSVSAWVASAIRAKAQARAELIADLDDLERRDPTPPEVVAAIARTLGLPRGVVTNAIKRPRRPARRTG
ncbi:MAG: ribbon-helix-helix domain-containing protein [Sandaracinaceae bacterium]|nr:ribbon-helix-helix domain-containing protein [Sandaracinaceae bacterium]